MRQLIRKTRVHPAEHENSSPTLNLTSFGHIDFRNCRCMSIIDCIFMKLQQHIEYIGSIFISCFKSRDYTFDKNIGDVFR